MRHRVATTKKFNRSTSAKKALMQGLARSLFIHEKIETTLLKAKAVRPEAEKMISIAKSNTLANRRRLIAKLQDKELVEKLLSEIAPRFNKRDGGYTRIQRSFIRKGDNTQMAVLSIVEEKKKEAELETKSAKKEEKPKAKKPTTTKKSESKKEEKPKKTESKSKSVKKEEKK